MPGEPLIEWPQPVLELLGFVAVFAMAGPVGFRWAVLRGLSGTAAAPAERQLSAGMAGRAALWGLGGALIAAARIAMRLPEVAAGQDLSVVQLISGDPRVATQVGLLALALAGFALAAGRKRVGWVLATVGVIGGSMRGAFFGEWARIINPMHELAGGLWIGTLLCLVAIGIAMVMRSPLPSERRGDLVARMVRAFSPLALGSFALLGALGVLTAWRHLKRLDALWTTPYGYALLLKLVVVAGVVVLGAWNWRRVTPVLGTEASGQALRRSARNELLLAGVVLLITSILVSLPGPGE